jgi:hypothetical protein
LTSTVDIQEPSKDERYGRGAEGFSIGRAPRRRQDRASHPTAASDEKI